MGKYNNYLAEVTNNQFHSEVLGALSEIREADLLDQWTAMANEELQYKVRFTRAYAKCKQLGFTEDEIKANLNKYETEGPYTLRLMGQKRHQKILDALIAIDADWIVEAITCCAGNLQTVSSWCKAAEKTLKALQEK